MSKYPSTVNLSQCRVRVAVQLAERKLLSLLRSDQPFHILMFTDDATG